ncbi:MAG: 30S ribosome-binding factor RbfA [Bacteroidota bacterium]|nr:30S ribosome-binding factor RbfA [Bacteroidota bacterium]
MESNRKSKISRLIQKNISIIFQQESQNLFGKTMISVTKVYVSADFSSCKIFVSVFPVKDPQDILQLIKKHTSLFRKHLGLRLRNQLRIIPELHFFLDDSIDYVDEIERLLKK